MSWGYVAAADPCCAPPWSKAENIHADVCIYTPFSRCRSHESPWQARAVPYCSLRVYKESLWLPSFWYTVSISSNDQQIV